ncbi:hypothetical protein BaRGS_00005244 [Batillaria attramentaria]|uniref:Rhodanese domain-containing protein n=1 Tax=Batillaria attramentaria TaxID=370345 RepID=A0ABD0LVM1_9CAEN
MFFASSQGWAQYTTLWGKNKDMKRTEKLLVKDRAFIHCVPTTGRTTCRCYRPVYQPLIVGINERANGWPVSGRCQEPKSEGFSVFLQGSSENSLFVLRQLRRVAGQQLRPCVCFVTRVRGEWAKRLLQNCELCGNTERILYQESGVKMPKKGSSSGHNWSIAFSPREKRPRPKLFKEDRRTLKQILVDPMADGSGESTYRPDTADLEVQQIQVIRGVGEADLHDNSGGSRPVVNSIDCPYVLLDVRDKDDYEECHIITARSYPTAMLARSVNYERLKVACKLFPEGLVTGTIPAGVLEGAGSKGKRSHHPPPSTARTPADQTDFTQEDLDSLVLSIDVALSDNSSGSRLSQRSKGPGRGSVMSTTSTNAVHGRKPFKP